MALQDQNLVLSSAQTVTASAASTNIYDIALGNTITTTYVAATALNVIWGNSTYFGEDLGLGRGVGTPACEFFSGSGTPTTATSLQIALQGAPDAGGTATSGLTFTTYIETAAMPLASILASVRLAAFDLPKRQVGLALPRFLQFYYTVAGSNFAGLTITGYINMGGTSGQNTLGQYPSNY